MTAGLPRRCLECSAMTTTPRCPACRRRGGPRYGAEHRRARSALLAMLAAAGGPDHAVCPLCLEVLGTTDPGELHADHVIPLAAGGGGGWQLTHRKCNLAAGDKRGAVR